VQNHGYLRRLERENYQGDAWVHWSLTIEGRRVGWLTPLFLYRFREILCHTCFRYQLACGIYCLMPDHMHLLWRGLASTSDQLNGMKFFRVRVNEALGKVGYKLQRQAYDRVLREWEIERNELETIVTYLARNPERAGLLEADQFGRYPYTGCLLPGYPELKLFQPDSWSRFWRAMNYLERTELFRHPDPRLPP